MVGIFAHLLSWDWQIKRLNWSFLCCKDTKEQCNFKWQGDYAFGLIQNGYFIEMRAAAALDVQKEWIETTLDEQKVCILEIKGHMSQLQDGMKAMIHVLRLIHHEVGELKAKPRNRNIVLPGWQWLSSLWRWSVLWNCCEERSLNSWVPAYW
jgi:hypothetical protein